MTTNYRMLDNAELLARAKNIKPVFQTASGLQFMEPVDLKGQAFTWAPKAAEKATDLIPLAEIPTLHTFSYYGFFKPSMAEVLSQIPEGILDKVVAVKTEMKSGDISELLTEDQKYHQGITTLYSGVIPESVKAQPLVLRQ